MDLRVCPWWLAYFFDHPLRRFVHNPERMFAGLIQAGQTAVDLGCGMGYFTLALARMIGPTGRVIAVDFQPQMLKVLQRRARRRELSNRILLHKCTESHIGLEVQADFALAFWMVHEVPDPAVFLREVSGLLRPGGCFMLVEPIHHVTTNRFRETLDLAQASGLQIRAQPNMRLSYAALFERQPIVQNGGHHERAAIFSLPRPFGDSCSP